MKQNLLSILFIGLMYSTPLWSQDINSLGSTIRLFGEWEVSDVWYDLPVDINLDGFRTKFAAFEYDYCQKHQILDFSLLDGKVTHRVGNSPICSKVEAKHWWHIEEMKIKILGAELTREVIVVKNRNHKKIGQLVILDTNQYEMLLYGKLPKDRFAKPGFIHLSRVIPAYTTSRTD